ncbi:chaperone NapD [Algibacillus agarilyticus]|uniref:chaperone NapD n=1 Tax=Algibacillus agarilyticus TaxID=2234133 RepID=UPI000DD0CEE6|nr:chaperone NapD [Algibacillus agarilyticus]
MSEYHVASFIVRTMKADMPSVIDSCNQIEGCEIHGHDGQGKIVVTMEGHSHKHIAKLSDALNQVKNIIDISPVYHEYFDESIEENAA